MGQVERGVPKAINRKLWKNCLIIIEITTQVAATRSILVLSLAQAHRLTLTSGMNLTLAQKCMVIVTQSAASIRLATLINQKEMSSETCVQQCLKCSIERIFKEFSNVFFCYVQISMMSKCPTCPNVHDVVTLVRCDDTQDMWSHLSHVVTLVTCGHNCHMLSQLSHMVTLVTCCHTCHKQSRSHMWSNCHMWSPCQMWCHKSHMVTQSHTRHRWSHLS